MVGKKHKAKKIVRHEDHLRSYAAALLAATRCALDFLLDENPLPEDKRKLVGQLRGVIYNATSEGAHERPYVTIVCENGFVAAVQTDWPDVLNHMLEGICVIDLDDIEDPDDLTSIRFRDGSTASALVYAPDVETPSVRVESGQKLKPNENLEENA